MPTTRSKPRKTKPKVLAKLSADEAIKKLEAVHSELAQPLKQAVQENQNGTRLIDWFFGRPEPVFLYAAHSFGYIPKQKPHAREPMDISHAGSIKADAKLQGKSIKLTLDRLRVKDYPGGKEHNILFEFSGQHQAKDAEQAVKFAQVYRVREEQEAGITGYPIFIGLNVGDEGVAFKCYTINVSNTGDKQFLEFLDNPVFKRGLKLLGNVHPMVDTVTEFTTAILKLFAKRDENVAVQDFFMGLDFSGIATRAQLREGSYIAVQAPNGVWDWSQWVYTPATGQIVRKDNHSEMIQYNYVVFGVSLMKSIKQNTNTSIA
jgi:archaellin